MTDGVEEIGGERYMRDAGGRLVPLEMVKEQHKLQDQTVRSIFAKADELSKTIAAFREGVFSDVDQLLELLEQQYKAKPGGAKGNITLLSYDGLLKVQVSVADLIRFGPELQVAKQLAEECAQEWVEGARAELRVIVMNAFQADKEGQLRTTALLQLLRYEIEDDRWKRAMAALRDSMLVVGTKRYVRFYRRAKPTDQWTAVSIDIATA